MHNEKVWFYALENDGYSLDDNRKKLEENPLPILKSEYTARKTATYPDRKNHFFVDLAEIQKEDLEKQIEKLESLK